MTLQKLVQQCRSKLPKSGVFIGGFSFLFSSPLIFVGLHMFLLSKKCFFYRFTEGKTTDALAGVPILRTAL